MITYITFSEGFKFGAEEFYRAKVNEIALSIDREIQKAVYETTMEVSPFFLADPLRFPDALQASVFCDQLLVIANQKSSFRSLFFSVGDSVSGENQLACASEDVVDSTQFFENSMVSGKGTQEVTLKNIGGSYYFVWPLEMRLKNQMNLSNGGKKRQIFNLIAEFDSQKFTSQIISSLDLGRGFLYVSLGDKILFHAGEKNEAVAEAMSKAMASDLLSDAVEDSSTLVFRSPIQSAGLTFSYGVPQEIFFENLLTLKNRIIAASLILAWIAIWVVLILAYRISRPILSLARVSNDMIKFNYTSPMDIDPSNDEIGDLAKSFETMRQEIERHVTLDPLTKTSNRRYLMHVFVQEIERALRQEQPLSCIMLDIDYFKKINDTYGHQAGDEVLKELGRLLIEVTRKYDVVSSDTVGLVARYGGEEFTVLLPAADIDEAFNVAERIRTMVESHSMSNSLSCTLSLGVAELTPFRNETPDTLIKKADTALYQAKEQGRNRTVRYDEHQGIEQVG